MITVGGFTRPRGRLRVNYGSAFSHRLGSLWVADRGNAGSPARLVDLVANAEARAYGTPVPYIEDTFNGLAVSVPRAAAYARGASAGSIPWRPFTAGGYLPGTVLWLGSIIDYDTGGSIYGFINSGGPLLQIIQGNAGQLGFQVMMNSYQVTNPPQNTLARDNIICVVGTTRSVTDHEVAVCHWSLGTSYPTPISVTTFSGNAGTATQDPAYEAFGGDPTSPTSFDGTNRYHLAASWSRGMARDELVSLAQNPWQVVRPQVTRFSALSSAARRGRAFIIS